jgi:recombination protein RecA
MPSAASVRVQIEAALSSRIPSALTPTARVIRPVSPTGINSLDAALDGGLPLGTITELVGSECSGRTSLALAFVARMTREGKVCAWIDTSDTLQPESAAACGIDLARLLWVRCGPSSSTAEPESQTKFQLPEQYLIAPPIKKGLHGGGFGAHPRNQVKGLSEALTGLLHPEALAARCAEPQKTIRRPQESFVPNVVPLQRPLKQFDRSVKPWSRLDQSLRVTDLLLQAGGFSAIVIDIGSVAAEHALRVPLATWFRYRAAAERTQASVLLLSQHACAKSSAGLVLRLEAGKPVCDETTVQAGIEHRVEIDRQRFSQASNVIPLRRPPQSERGIRWQSRSEWVGPR